MSRLSSAVVKSTNSGILRYTSPVLNDPGSDEGRLAARNYENSALFLVSCFQYILVAAVFSIGPPYRKPMWTNSMSFLSFCVTLC